MAKYFTNFSEYTSDQQPSDWTIRGSTSPTWVVKDDATATGGKVLNHSATSSLYSFLTWDDVGVTSDTEIVARIGIGTKVSAFLSFLTLRCNGDASDHYSAIVHGGGYLYLYRYKSGVGTHLAGTTIALNANSYFWVRFRVNGTSLKIRYWIDGATEPSTWDIQYIDNSTNKISTGNSGVGWYYNGYQPHNFDVISIGTDGDTAPTTGLDVATNAATNITLNSATLNGAINSYTTYAYSRYFEYGTTTSYGTVVDAGSGVGGIYSVNITGLNYSTVYHYRAYINDGTNNVYGSDQTFTTADRPIMKPTNLYPQNISLFYQNPVTFTWGIDSQAVQTHYELRYRVVGVSSWTTTGTVASTQKQHVFTAGAFSQDSNFEWQVKSWDSSEPEFYDWSDIVNFNTIYPPSITNISPANSSGVNVGLINFSCTITSSYNRNCRLKIKIATDSNFTDPAEYTGVFQKSGTTHTIQAPITHVGTLYVRFIAEDSTGLTKQEDISLSVTQQLYFISEPNVSLQSPLATHVTVKVKNTTTEATANITPEPAADKKIERLVEIDSGDVNTCTTVAQKLIARWGVEQKNVSGEILPTANLDFKRKVKVVIPQAGIDEDMVLQKKEHIVTQGVTRVELGDILLSDSELLTRILDELS